MKKLIIFGACIIAVIIVTIIVSSNKSNENADFGAELVRPSKDSAESTYAESVSGGDSSESESVSEYETYKDAEILRVVSFTSVVEAGDDVALTLSGMPNTRYDIYVYYSKNPATDQDLEPKMSDGEGNLTWEWSVPSSVKAGMREIKIVGGGEILTIYLDVQ